MPASNGAVLPFSQVKRWNRIFLIAIPVFLFCHFLLSATDFSTRTLFNLPLLVYLASAVACIGAALYGSYLGRKFVAQAIANNQVSKGVQKLATWNKVLDICYIVAILILVAMYFFIQVKGPGVDMEGFALAIAIAYFVIFPVALVTFIMQLSYHIRVATLET